MPDSDSAGFAEEHTGEEINGWWTISDVSLRAMLHRAHKGEDPDMVMMEEYANSVHEYPDGSDE